ncbi:hypothetical protein ABPG74_007712 [Tetrahymena malaccensis]
MSNIQQIKNNQKKCYFHKEQNICYIQVRKQKQSSVGGCCCCVTENHLNGKNLALVSDVQKMINNEQPSLNDCLPILDDKEILKDCLTQLSSVENKDRRLQIEQFCRVMKEKMITSLDNFKEKILQKSQEFVDQKELLKTVESISQKGQFKYLFQEYMSDDQNDGVELSKFISDKVRNSKQNTELLKKKIQAFKDCKELIKIEQPVQQKLQNIILDLIEMAGQTFQFYGDNNILQLQQIENVCDSIIKLKQLKIQNQNQNQIQNYHDQNKKILLQFIYQNYKSISKELTDLSQNVIQSEIQLVKSLEENKIKNQLPIINQFNEYNILNKFNQDVVGLADRYQISIQAKLKICPAQLDFQKLFSLLIQNSQDILVNIKLPIIDQIINLEQNQKFLSHQISFQEQIFYNRYYKFQIQFKPIQNREEHYSFWIGFKTCDVNSQNKLDQFKNSFYLSNKSKHFKTKALKGFNINSPKISQSEQMRNLEFVFCLQDNKLELSDFPKQQNITIMNDECLRKLNPNSKYSLFILTTDIQEIRINCHNLDQLSQPNPVQQKY